MPPENSTKLNLRNEEAQNETPRSLKTRRYFNNQKRTSYESVKQSIQTIGTRKNIEKSTTSTSKENSSGYQTSRPVPETTSSDAQTRLGRMQTLQKLGGSIYTTTRNEIERIGYGTFFLMVGTALLFDVLKDIIGLVPIVGEVVDPLIGIGAGLTFWLWFKIKEIPLTGNSRIMYILGTLIDIIPILDILLLIPCTVTVVGSILINAIQNSPEAGAITSGLSAGSKILQ